MSFKISYNDWLYLIFVIPLRLGLQPDHVVVFGRHVTTVRRLPCASTFYLCKQEDSDLELLKVHVVGGNLLSSVSAVATDS